jgi:hypothetical protein
LRGLNSRAAFEHEVDRRLGGTAHAGEATGRERFAEARSSGLGAERQFAAVRERVGVQSIVETA